LFIILRDVVTSVISTLLVQYFRAVSNRRISWRYDWLPGNQSLRPNVNSSDQFAPGGASPD